MNLLPIDIKKEIVLILDLKTIYVICQLNKEFKKIITDENYWNNKIKSEYHYNDKPLNYKWIRLYYELNFNEIKRIEIYVNHKFFTYIFLSPYDKFDILKKFTSDKSTYVLFKNNDKYIDATWFLIEPHHYIRNYGLINKIFPKITSINLIDWNHHYCKLCGANNIDCLYEYIPKVHLSITNQYDNEGYITFITHCEICGMKNIEKYM